MIPGTQEPKNPRTQELRIRNSKLSTILLCSVFCILLSLAACNQPTAPDADASGSPDMIRRAQLVGQENIQLKRQIETLEAEIADLKGQLEAEQTRYAEFTDKQADLYQGLMRIILECQTKLNMYEQGVVN